MSGIIRNELDIDNIYVLDIILYDNSEWGRCIWSSEGVVVYGRAKGSLYMVERGWS